MLSAINPWVVNRIDRSAPARSCGWAARLTVVMTTMDYAEPAVPLGEGRMPLLGFGTWQISNAEAPAATVAALEPGYRHIDTATGYENEAGIGQALRTANLPRDSVFLTTKCLRTTSVGNGRRWRKA
jgi:2,5-diketo-D-gluconate reductase A